MTRLKPILFLAEIPFRTASKKNQKTVLPNGRAFYSPQFRKWEQAAAILIRQKAIALPKPIDVPINLAVVFEYKNHQWETDLSNVLQSVEDLLEKCNVISNDKLIHSLNGTRKMFTGQDHVSIEITEI